jgi:hypothetical protein
MDTPANLYRPLARWLLVSRVGVCWYGMPHRTGSPVGVEARLPAVGMTTSTLRPMHSQGQLDVRPWSCLLKDSAAWLMRRMQIR